ncbi:MAG: hypothetical protein MSG64_14970 [Pyrinomonadaceae bacterium MAG19_C2-C3]|nr:hypothetical protein [Pyrinomonadaceae bacterium MAG19_C2-C3]
MDWVIFILPAVLVVVGLALVLTVRYDYRVRRDAERARADEDRLAARLNARHLAKARQQASWQSMTPLAIEDAFDRFASHDVAHDVELVNQVDTAFDEFIRTMHDATYNAPQDVDNTRDAKPPVVSSK